MMVTLGCRIPAHRSPSTLLTASRRRPAIPWGHPQPASLPVRGCANESGGSARATGQPTADTRIHWGSSDEGWVGMPPPPTAAADAVSPEEELLSTWRNVRDENLLGILVQATDSHYRYLELTPDADADDIKAAYRRLSKTYHPDITSLPLELAAERFVRLKDAYNVLSNEEQRRLYDWQLAQKVLPLQDGWSMTSSENGKTMADDGSRVAQAQEDSDMVYNRVDTLRGRNMDLSAQAQTALAFDAFAILVSILSIIYAIYFKQT